MQLSNVSISYKPRRGSSAKPTDYVLKDVSLELHRGETLGIIGRNGVGKTTILRVMAGIIPATRGSVTRQKNTSAALLTIALGFRPDLSGRDNAILSSMLQGATKAQAISYLDEIQEFSELGEAFDAPVKTYSSGMRSRLGFSTALITHVDILLVDEILSVGDAHFKHKAEKAMKERIGGDQTVVFVSHSDKQIEELCDRAIWINDAAIVAEGDSGSVIQQYREHITTLNRQD